MHTQVSRYLVPGTSRWGIFTNLFNRADRMSGAGSDLPLGHWYLHVHTPLLSVRFWATTDGPTLTYLGRKYGRTYRPLRRGEG